MIPLSDRGIRIVVWALLWGFVASAAVMSWWLFLDPIVPKMRVLHSEVWGDGPMGRIKNPGSFEVIRTIESDRTENTRVCAYFKRRSSPEELVFEGQTVVPSTMTLELACTDTILEKGIHTRDRRWQAPLLPDGPYFYVSTMRFCNPLRCKWFELTAVPVVLE